MIKITVKSDQIHPQFRVEYRHGCDWYLFGVYEDRSYAETWALIMREEGREARVTEVKGEQA